ncbi:MAG: hypothetical protein ACYSVY_25130, partial [Planctomycetota bacterium]
MDWKERERSKFRSNEYKDVPWHAEGWAIGSMPDLDHFAHVSTADPSKLAYTASEKHGEADRQTRMKPGKYLKKYFGDVLDAKEIQRWAGAFAGENENIEVGFATDPDDIVEVYENGPRSCMSSQDAVRVYGAGDLAIAYLGPQDDATARALCWPAKQVFGRIYGDGARLGQALMAMGYSEAGRTGFNGARLLLEREGSGYVCPYIDYGYHVEV